MIQKLSKLGLLVAILTFSACVVAPDGYYGGGPAYYDGYYGSGPSYYPGYYGYAPVYPWTTGVNVRIGDFGRGGGHYGHGGNWGHGRGGRR